MVHQVGLDRMNLGIIVNTFFHLCMLLQYWWFLNEIGCIIRLLIVISWNRWQICIRCFSLIGLCKLSCHLVQLRDREHVHQVEDQGQSLVRMKMHFVAYNDQRGTQGLPLLGPSTHISLYPLWTIMLMDQDVPHVGLAFEPNPSSEF